MVGANDTQKLLNSPWSWKVQSFSGTPVTRFVFNDLRLFSN